MDHQGNKNDRSDRLDLNFFSIVQFRSVDATSILSYEVGQCSIVIYCCTDDLMRTDIFTLYVLVPLNFFVLNSSEFIDSTLFFDNDQLFF